MKNLKFWLSNIISLLTTFKLIETSDYLAYHYGEKRAVLSKEEVQKRFLLVFGLYFIGNENHKPVEFIPLECFGIQYIKVFETDNFYLVEIKLRKPGMLIGKGGKTIDGLKEFLTTDSKEVVIHLVEEHTKLHYDGDYIYEW